MDRLVNESETSLFKESEEHKKQEKNTNGGYCLPTNTVIPDVNHRYR